MQMRSFAPHRDRISRIVDCSGLWEWFLEIENSTVSLNSESFKSNPLTWYGLGFKAVSEPGLVLPEGMRQFAWGQKKEWTDQTSYGSFFRVPKDGIFPSFWVSAQWKIRWYSFGSSSCAGMANAVVVVNLWQCKDIGD